MLYRVTLKKTTPAVSLLDICRGLILAVSLLSPSLTFANELNRADVRQVIEWAASQSNQTILIDEGVSGEVTLIDRANLAQGDVWPLFLSIIDSQGLTLSRTNGVYRVSSGARLNENVIIDPRGERAFQMIELSPEHRTDVDRVLDELFEDELTTTWLAQSNALVLFGYRDSLAAAEQAIDRVIARTSIGTELFELNFADARTMSELIERSLAPILQDHALEYDVRSNTIILTAPDEQRRAVAQLISQLDRATGRTGDYRIIRLRYANAADITEALTAVASDAAPSSATSPSTTGRRLSIEFDDASNSIILRGDEAETEAMAELISHLDVRRPQVLVRAYIVEVNEEVANELGIFWQVSNDGVGKALGFNGLNGDQIPTGPDLPIGGGIIAGFLEDGQFSVIMKALEGNSDANILSTPSIVTLDNEEAEILVGENVPFITGSQSRPGDINPFQVVERQDIGVTLKVLPQINSDRSVTLFIEQSVESIGAPPAGVSTADIVTNKRSLSTHVLVDDGAILVLGGLIRDEQQEVRTKVPLLGDIPLLGHLFKGTEQQRVKKNLMVFLQPIILSSSEAANAISQPIYQQFRDMQRDYDSTPFWFDPWADSPELPTQEP